MNGGFFVLKMREMQDVPQLFDLVKDPAVFPYVREKAETLDQYYFLTKQSIEAEQNGEIISRTILSDNHQPIGIISLFDIQANAGFLSTWIGAKYFGKGYNQLAKTSFFQELFFTTSIDKVFMKIRQTNIRSQKANTKLPYVESAMALYPHIYTAINMDRTKEDSYDLFFITKDSYFRHTTSSQEIIS